MSVCLICLAWAAPWLWSAYGRELNMVGMGRPMAAVSLWACAQYVWHTYLHTRDAAIEITMLQTLHLCMFLLRGPPHGCALPVGVCLTCLAWADLWLWSQYVWHGPPYGRVLTMSVCFICLAWPTLWLRSHYERVLNMFGMAHPMAAVSLWACA